MISGLIKSNFLKSKSNGIKVPENLANRYIELTLLKKLLKHLEINCVIDVGANEGQFAGDRLQGTHCFF